eukprot:COSAG02_NODE_4913_length_4840_cov_2.322717_6_plen_252_part_00
MCVWRVWFGRRKQGASARKDARSKLLLQKRQCTAAGAAPAPAVAITAEQLATLVGSITASAEALGQLRQLLCTEEPPVSQALGLGVMEQLCALLQPGVDSALALEAAWCVTNIASSGLSESEAQHVLGASPLLIGHLGNSATPDIQCQAAWSIGNLAADSDTCRATLRSGGAVPPLVASLGSPAPALVHTAAWALSNLARGGAQSPADLVAAGILPPVRTGFKTLVAASHLTDLHWCCHAARAPAGHSEWP